MDDLLLLNNVVMKKDEITIMFMEKKIFNELVIINGIFYINLQFELEKQKI